MIVSACIASVYLLQLGAKAWLAARYARRVRTATSAPSCADDVTIVQPILSGDRRLEPTLAANVKTLRGVRFLWLVDDDDPEGVSVCERLAAASPEVAIAVLRCPPPAQGVNPKAHKLARALEYIETRVFVVLDDDTRLTLAGLAALMAGLDSGASLATGLPRYGPADGRCSGWLAEFVNSAAVLTYLPVLAFAEPLSIHGMCYAMRTAEARGMDVFRLIDRALTDDLALAQALRRRGLKIVQTIEPHDIATSVPSVGRLMSILHRWFFFTRLLIEECSWRVRAGIALAYALPPVLLLALFARAPFSIAGASGLVATLVVREFVLRRVKKDFLGAGLSHWALASIVLEIAQPAFLAAAFFCRTIRWRTRLIRVRSVTDFHYV